MKRSREHDEFDAENNKKSKILKKNLKSYETEIINAVANNDIELFQKIMNNNSIDISNLAVIVDEFGRGLLTIALSNKHGEMIDFLLEKFSKVKVDLTHELNELIIEACIEGNIKFIHLLLDIKVQARKDASGNNAVQNQKLTFDQTTYAILQIAAENKHTEVVKLIFHHTFKFYKVDENFKEVMLSFLSSEDLHNSIYGEKIQHTELTPLHIAAESGFIDIVKIILDYKVNLNIGDNKGSTPLHLAVREDQDEIAMILLKKGADIEAKDGNSRTPVYLAISLNKAKVLKLLTEHGADIDQFTYVGIEEAPIELAVNIGNAEAVKILLKNGCELQDREFEPEFYEHPKASEIVYPLIVSKIVEFSAMLKKVSDNKNVASNTMIVDPCSQNIDFYYGPEAFDMEKLGFSMDQDDLNLAKERFEKIMIKWGLWQTGDFSQNTYESYKVKLQETGCQNIFGENFLNEIFATIDLHHSKYDSLISSLQDILILGGYAKFDSTNIDHEVFFKALTETEFAKDCGFSTLDYYLTKQPVLEKIFSELNSIILPYNLKSIILSLKDYNDDSYKAELEMQVAAFEAELTPKDSQAMGVEFSVSAIESGTINDVAADYIAILNGETSQTLEANW